MKKVGIGKQDFASLREEKCFYIDKTSFIKDWWNSKDDVTLITRPRRFGKTLNMSMVECFFSDRYKNRGDLFEGLEIWEDPEFRAHQGKWPVLFLSFASVKNSSYEQARKKICSLIKKLYRQNDFLLEGNTLSEDEKQDFAGVTAGMDEATAADSLHNLCLYLSRYHGRKVIILLDEYDTPLQEAYVNGYWQELVSFTRGLFNSTFKTNPYLERGLMTGITRVSKKSIFSDLNNLKVVTTGSSSYEAAFGFTEGEVSAALDEQGMSGEKENVRKWYDGFSFGGHAGIYNPWSITNFLDTGKLEPYWANSSSNALVSRLLQKGPASVKKNMETLLSGGTVRIMDIDEQIVFDQLYTVPNAVYSLLLAGGYLKVTDTDMGNPSGHYHHDLRLTNFEVSVMFDNMVRSWFAAADDDYGEFVRAMLMGDPEAMNHYMNEVALATFSSFDTGKSPSKKSAPERFYHGFVLGLLVDRRNDYVIRSNRESGFGRYDVVMEPLNDSLPAIIMEFKVKNPAKEKSLKETASAALQQIEEKRYDTELLEKGILQEKILKYGFAFEGSTVLIGKAE